MSWKASANAPLGLPQPGSIASAGGTAVGTIATFVEDTLGAAELIYLPGVAGLVAGDTVDYSLAPGAQAIARHTNATGSNKGWPVAIAVDAPQAGQFGWFQISGVAIANVVAGTAPGAVMGTATAGQLGNTADAGDQILNARILTAVGMPAAGQSYAQIMRPFVQGQIT